MKMKQKCKQVAVCLSPSLWAHIKSVQKYESHMEGRPVSVSELIREALIEHYAYGDIKIFVDQHDSLTEQILKESVGR
jgi:hypothetical protein